MSDDPEVRYLRAREVLRDAGFVFDEFVNAEMRKILISNPEDTAAREIAYTRARVATDLKLLLEGEVTEYENGRTMKERRDGRRNQHPDA
jgi:hypothetical protein